MTDEQKQQLKIALLDYLRHGKPIRQAADREQFTEFDRQDIKNMTAALLLAGLLYRPYGDNGLKTSSVIYRTTALGRKHLAELVKEKA